MTAHDVTCLTCGCLCDDLQVSVKDNHIVQVENACPVGESWLRYPDANPQTVEALIEGRPVSLHEGVNAVAEQLARAKFPLVFGLSELDVDGQRAACALADEIGAALDSGTAFDPLPMYFPTVGAMGCTWGEVVQRADVIVYWQCDPDQLQPRHRERILGRIQETRTVQVISDIPAKWGFETIWQLRALVQGRPTGLEPSAELLRLAETLKSAKYAVIVHDASHPSLIALQALATDVNRHTRCRLMALAGPGNITGQAEVMLWQTGYERGVGLHRGYPASAGGEFTAERLLNRGEVDLAISFGRGAHRLSESGKRGLAQIPHIAITFGNQQPVAQTVLFASVPGIHTTGTVFRSDRVTLPVRPILSTSFPDAALVLNQVLAAVRSARQVVN